MQTSHEQTLSHIYIYIYLEIIAFTIRVHSRNLIHVFIVKH